MSDGLAPPDGGTLINLIVPADQLAAKRAEAETLPKVPLTDVDVNWLQVTHTVGGGGVVGRRFRLAACPEGACACERCTPVSSEARGLAGQALSTVARGVGFRLQLRHCR